MGLVGNRNAMRFVIESTTDLRFVCEQQREEADELRAQLTKLQRVAEQLEAATARATAAEKHAKAAEWDLEVFSNPDRDF